jgi:2-polyprenyl-3-methyl-5-hydroxy-6-metoxy-1,4-benzoquinol methylase
MDGDAYVYVGSELEVFRHAHNWKRYWSSAIGPYVSGDVLEVGAGVGANSPYLLRPGVRKLVCLEPDRRFGPDLERGRDELAAVHAIPIEVRHGTVQAQPAGEQFDSILYIDVLEHLENDRGEVAGAAGRLRPGGHLIVLSPAFQALYSEFDRAIGHYRRYTAPALRALTPGGLVVRHLTYLDALGASLSAANRLLLRKAQPTIGAIMFWDRYVIPISRVVDLAVGRLVGRSVLCVWQKQQ